MLQATQPLLNSRATAAQPVSPCPARVATAPALDAVLIGAQELRIALDSFERDVRVDDLTQEEHEHLARVVLTAARSRPADARQPVAPSKPQNQSDGASGSSTPPAPSTQEACVLRKALQEARLFIGALVEDNKRMTGQRACGGRQTLKIVDDALDARPAPLTEAARG